MCICPDGRPANGVMGSTAIVCDGGGYQNQAPSGVSCGWYTCPEGSQCSPDGGCMREGDSYCGGGKTCSAGYKCSRGGGCVPDDADDCGHGSSCPAGRVCWTASEDVAGERKGETTCPTPERRDQLEKQIGEQRKQRREEERKAGVKKDIAAHEKESETARERLERLLSTSEQQRQQTELKKSIPPLQNSPVMQQLDARARGEAPSTTSVGVDLRGLQGGGVVQLKPSANPLEQRTIGATAVPPASLSTFTCGAAPNQYPCPTTVGPRTAPNPSSETRESDLGPFDPGDGSNAVTSPSRQLSPRQQEHARRDQERRTKEADEALAKAADEALGDAPQLDCPFWKNITRCQTPSGFPGKTCRWCRNGNCDDSWFCR